MKNACSTNWAFHEEKVCGWFGTAGHTATFFSSAGALSNCVLPLEKVLTELENMTIRKKYSEILLKTVLNASEVSKNHS